MSDFFNLESYYNHLETIRLGRPCVYLDKVESTIDVALSAEPNTLVIAREQTKGRGQRTNVWQSPAGCAMGSLKMALNKTSLVSKRLSFLQHIMVIVAAKTLGYTDEMKLNKNTIRLKWPNDIIYLNPRENKVGQKIGGVLVQSVDLGDSYSVIISFGLNVFNSTPTTCIKDIIGGTNDLDLGALVAKMVNRLEEYTYLLDEEKFEMLKLEYNERCIQINRIINDENSGQVKVREVNDDGYLIGERCSDRRLCVVTKITSMEPA